MLLCLAAIFGPLTSGYPVVLSLCGTGDADLMVCGMGGCEDGLPGSSTISGMACCAPHVLADGVSKAYVKPYQPVLESAVAPLQAFSASVEDGRVDETLPRHRRVPDVHAPPLYLSLSTLLI